MDLGIIVAVSENDVIGKDNKLPWRIPEDLKHFKKKTLGLPVIMGRKTYESIGKPLVNRRNIVLSRSIEGREGIEVYGSLDDAIETLEREDFDRAYIIGGSQVYNEAFPIADFLDITRVHRDVDGDSYFPEINDRDWKEIYREDREGFSFLTYYRNL